MKKMVNKEERNARKLTLSAETLRTLSSAEMQQAAGAATVWCQGGTTACTGSADCCDYH